MTEIFGLAAGTAEFVSLLFQVANAIDTLRDISNRADKAPAQLDSLLSELTFLIHLMQEVIAKRPCKDDLVVQHCHASCNEVVRGLEKLKRRLPNEVEGVGKQKMLKIFFYGTGNKTWKPYSGVFRAPRLT